MSEKVLVVYGGTSSEREISLRSGRAVADALRRNGYSVIEYDFDGNIEAEVKKHLPDLVFVMLHGKPGEDGTVQGALEYLGVAYTGSDLLSSAICMNKLFTKLLLLASGIPTPAYFSLRRGEEISFGEATAKLGSGKLVIKPNDQGSTIGVSIVNNEKDFVSGVRKAFDFSETILVEEYIEGTEVTVSIIGNYPNAIVLPVIEIVPAHSFYDFESKYLPGMSKHIIPARISKEASIEASLTGKRIYELFNLRDLARIDMIVRNDKPYVLEINTIPGFTQTSLVPDAAKACGYSFDSLVDFIAKEALKRKK